MIHELKTWPGYFERLADGSKTFEIRKDDRGYQTGDDLLLREWDHSRGDHDTCYRANCTTSRYTGRELRFRVGFVAKGDLFGLALGAYAVLSLLPIEVAE